MESHLQIVTVLFFYALHPVVCVDIGVYMPSHNTLVLLYIISKLNISVYQSVYSIEHYIFCRI
jgi:hypothetical protein